MQGRESETTMLPTRRYKRKDKPEIRMGKQATVTHEGHMEGVGPTGASKGSASRKGRPLGWAVEGAEGAADLKST